MMMERYTRSDGKGRSQRFLMLHVSLSMTMTCVFLSGCDPLGPSPIRFGSDGLVRVTVEVPLQGGIGWMQQVLTWRSDGAWKLFEEIGYDSVVGDQSLLRHPGLPYTFAANYVSLLHLVNDNKGTKLFGLKHAGPECGIGKSRVSFLIRDNMRDEQKEWTRCAANASPLRGLKTDEFDPDNTAARVIQVSLRARDFTLGANFDGYAYTGSLPFATLQRGTRTGMELDKPTFFRSPDGEKQREAPQGWLDFWKKHTAASGREPPEIDWAKEMVLVAAIGVRHEAGDSAEVRRVLLVGDERDAKFEVVEREPGDYCAPAERTVRPYHIAVTPKTRGTVSYGVRVEKVPCGL